MKKTIKLCFAVALAAISAIAQDLKITFTELTSFPPRMSAPSAAGSGVVRGRTTAANLTGYYAGQSRRTNNEAKKQDVLIDYKERVVYEINHGTKTIAKFNFDDMAAVTELANANTKEADIQFAEQAFGKAGDVKVKKTGSEKIAGRRCEKWEITVWKVVCKLSVDPTIYISVPLGDFLAAEKIDEKEVMDNSAINNVFTKLYEEIYKTKGTPLKMAMTFQHPQTGQMATFTVTAKKIEVEPNIASALALPSGYKLEDKGGAMVEQMRKGGSRAIPTPRAR
jgi:hypothetical protein